MRTSQAERDKSHRRIVQGASSLLRRQGIEATSVNDVMKKAGLTHGGFYRHFDSKEALVSASLEDAFDEMVNAMDDSYRLRGTKKGVQQYYENYLSMGHVMHPEIGCPIAALSMDVARSTTPVKASFGLGFQRSVDKLAEAGNGNSEENKAAAIQRICMLAGAVMIARALDAQTALDVLEACKPAADLQPVRESGAK